MPTNDDLLFAEHAIKAGFVSREEVEASVSVLRRMEDMGVKDSLRNVMVNRGVLREGDAALAAKAAGFSPGRDPIPGFTLESRIGTGAMGSVYKAFQKGMQRHVAVKILRRDLTSDARQVERLRREAAVVGKLDHPHIVRGLASGETNGLVWFAMEFVDGETLRERIRRLGRVPPDDAIVITRQLAEALEHAHSQGIVHRDIKPGNVLLTKTDVPRLSDYGLAKAQTDDALTQIDATLGTPQYVAPEQARNPRDADIRSDIYSLGATLYTMLCGRPPFEGETLAQTLTKVLYERPRPLQELVPDLPDPLVYVVERMMAKDRRYRYATPESLLHDLRDLERGRLRVPAGFTGDIAQFEERRRSRRVWLGGVAILAGAVVIALGVRWWDDRTLVERREKAARDAFADIRSAPGPEIGWDGATVQSMIQRLSEFRAEYSGTAAAQEAAKDLGRWRAQEQELKQLQPLVARREEETWPRRMADLAERQRALASDPNASVARAAAARALTEVRNERDRLARSKVEALREDPQATTLEEARRHWAALVDTLRTQYFAPGEHSESLAIAEQTEAAFREAAAGVERIFEPWKAVRRENLVESGKFRAAWDQLRRITDDVAADRRLHDLLEDLPPDRRWAQVAEARREATERMLTDAAAAAYATLRAEVERRLARAELREARTLVADFGRHALPSQIDAVDELTARVDDAIREQQRGTLDATALTADRFFKAYGAHNVGAAEQALEQLDRRLQGSQHADAAAAAFLQGARRLLELTQEKLWDRFRQNVARHAAAGGQLTDRHKGIRYAYLADVRAVGNELSFRWGGGQEWKGPFTDIDLGDVEKVAEVRLDDPETLLVLTALRLTQFRLDHNNPRASLAALDELSRRLNQASAAPGVKELVARLTSLAEERAVQTREAVDANEREAKLQHADARAALDGARFDTAIELLQGLLDTPRLRLTDYVAGRREEIQQQLRRAHGGKDTMNIAFRFPGALLTRSDGGTAELFWDFERPEVDTEEGRRALGIPDGRVELRSRLLLAADRPGRARADGMDTSLRLDHFLHWPEAIAADRASAPLTVDCPFQARKRIEVSFSCRADDPFFVAVAISGTAAGILSEPESLHAGRGVWIWNATDLANADADLDVQTRTTWQERNPDEVRRDADTRFFQFEAGRVHRVRFVREDRSCQLWVDGKLRIARTMTAAPPPSALQEKVVLVTYGSLDVDDLRIAGTLDPAWPNKK